MNNNPTIVDYIRIPPRPRPEIHALRDGPAHHVKIEFSCHFFFLPALPLVDVVDGGKKDRHSLPATIDKTTDKVKKERLDESC